MQAIILKIIKTRNIWYDCEISFHNRIFFFNSSYSSIHYYSTILYLKKEHLKKYICVWRIILMGYLCYHFSEKYPAFKRNIEWQSLAYLNLHSQQHLIDCKICWFAYCLLLCFGQQLYYNKLLIMHFCFLFSIRFKWMPWIAYFIEAIWSLGYFILQSILWSKIKI